MTSIGGAAFSDCEALTAITLPDGLTYIGMNAFNGCSSLTNLTLSMSLTFIGYGAFHNCDSLTLTVPLDSYAYQYAIDNGFA